MEILDGYEELPVDKEHSEIRMELMHVELVIQIRYFIKDGVIGYCGLKISGAKGCGLRGKLAAAAVKSYIGRTIFIFISETLDGKKLITVPSLFEKEPAFDRKLDLSDLIINAYYHDDFKKSASEVRNEHLDAMAGKKISNDRGRLEVSLLELPGKGIEILRSYR